MANSAAVFLSSLFNIPNGIKKDEDLISLKDLYKRTHPMEIDYSNDGNFIQANDGTILFFEPGVRRSLGYIAAEAPATSQRIFKTWSPETKKSTINELSIERNGDNLKIGKFTIAQAELDRHCLSCDFTTVIKYCLSLFPSPRQVEQGGLCACSIVRLEGSRFLITGGESCYIDKTTEMKTMTKTATVFDAKTGEVVKTFPLCSPRSRHNSLRLPNGKVLLLGGFAQQTPMEIIDVQAGSSRYLSCQFQVMNWCFTACIDGEGNCYVIGGFNSETHKGMLTVDKIDLQQELITTMPDIKLPRAFRGAPAPYSVQQNALILEDNSILISGGQLNFSTPLGGKSNLTAEIYRPANYPSTSPIST